MSISPHITFKAGICDFDDESHRIVPKATPGYIYLYTEDELLHFCWRPRSAPINEPELDLIMFPTDGSFKPYQKHGSRYKAPEGESAPASVTSGRMYVLRFLSSSVRHLFWLQSKSQSPVGDPSWHSPRDVKLGEIVNELLTGSEIDVQQELASIPDNEGGGPEGDNDTSMEDADAEGPGSDHHRAGSGGAGAGATGGDFREEGEEAREGGADGGRAAAPGTTETQAAVADFLKSLHGSQAAGGQAARDKPSTTLPDLLRPEITLPILDTADDSYLDELLSNLPTALIMLAASADEASALNPDPETVQAVMMSLDIDLKKSILTKVLRSPQFSQSLGSLTMALRDGGLPTISEALKIQVANGGYTRRGGLPLGGGEAVEAFLNGIKTFAEGEGKEGDAKMGGR